MISNVRSMGNKRIAVIVAILIATGGWYVYKTRSITVNVRRAPVAESAGPTRITLNNYPATTIAATASPFSAQPTGSSATTSPIPTSTGAIPKPPIPSIPSGAVSVPDKGFPVAAAAANAVYEIRAIVTPSQGNIVAIISNGTEQMMVTEGAETPWGTVSDVSKKGLYLGERYLAVSTNPTFEDDTTVARGKRTTPAAPTASAPIPMPTSKIGGLS